MGTGITLWFMGDKDVGGIRWILKFLGKTIPESCTSVRRIQRKLFSIMAIGGI